MVTLTSSKCKLGECVPWGGGRGEGGVVGSEW